MKSKYGLLLLLVALITTMFSVAYSMDNNNDKTDKIILSNRLFSVSLPKEAKNLYKAVIKKDKILIYDKISKKSGFGGFAFGIGAYKNPADHAMMPGARKLGELVKNDIIYDIVLYQPTDVQFDYVNGCSKSYELLYGLANNIDKNINGIKNAKYVNRQGMQGKELYNDILQKHVKAIKEKWNSQKLEDENMSYMYNVIATSGKDALKNIGYTYYDTNADGIEELIIGEIAQGSWKGIIYDMYTMVNRKPAHVMSGGARNRYFVCDNEFICNEYSGGAKESGWRVYVLVENSIELYPQVFFKYDAYTNPKKPWFISYDNTEEKWDNVSEKTFKERKKIFEGYERFNYKPLSSLK